MEGRAMIVNVHAVFMFLQNHWKQTEPSLLSHKHLLVSVVFTCFDCVKHGMVI